MTDSEGGFSLPKSSPVMVIMKEDLTAHSVEVLKARLNALRAETDRTGQAIADKGDAKQSAESFFK